MNNTIRLAALVMGMGAVSAHAATVLYTQNFENPVNFVNDGGDINIHRSVNDLYGNQPAGFTFAQPFTTETLLVGGTGAFGTGYKDPQARAGKYAVGMLSDAQDDRLALAFNVGSNKFLNFQLDISSIDLDRFGGPFVPAGGVAPSFRFSLYDNPSGATGLGSGTALSFAERTGTLTTSKFTFDWTNVIVGLDATGNTNGNVILEIVLRSGAGYAAFDNFTVAAADQSGVIPEPETWALLLAGLGAMGFSMRRSCGSVVGRLPAAAGS